MLHFSEQDSLYSDIYQYLHQMMPASVIKTALIQDFNSNQREHAQPDFDDQDFAAVLDEIDLSTMKDLFFETLISERPLSWFRQRPHESLHPGIGVSLSDVMDFKLKSALSQALDMTPSELTSLYRQLDTARLYLTAQPHAAKAGRELNLNAGPWRIAIESDRTIHITRDQQSIRLAPDALKQIHQAFDAWADQITDTLSSKKIHVEDWHYDCAP